MVNLIPEPESVMKLLTDTGAYRRGQFIYPNGKRASHYFQMPLAFRYYDNARILSVGLSRMFRQDKAVSSHLPNISVISPGPGGIMVAFGVRQALTAQQISWAEMENGKRQFRQYVSDDKLFPALIVDDINRTGRAISETIALVRELGADVIGIGTIVKFEDAPEEFDGIPARSLLSFDVNFYDTEEEWKVSRSASDAPPEHVRF